jgi:hypothetical protein
LATFTNKTAGSGKCPLPLPGCGATPHNPTAQAEIFAKSFTKQEKCGIITITARISGKIPQGGVIHV